MVARSASGEEEDDDDVEDKESDEHSEWDDGVENEGDLLLMDDEPS